MQIPLVCHFLWPCVWFCGCVCVCVFCYNLDGLAGVWVARALELGKMKVIRCKVVAVELLAENTDQWCPEIYARMRSVYVIAFGGIAATQRPL